MIFTMMAAHDTTTSSLTSLTYELAANPEWQERVRDEVRGFDKPVLAINTATYWWSLRQAGIEDKVPGWGSLLMEH